MEIITDISINSRYLLKLFVKRNKNVIDVDVLIPEEYPRTPFVQNLDNNILGSIVLVIQKEYNTLYLSSFSLFINKLYYQQFLLPNERQAFKGVGKKLLKFVINMFKDQIEPIDTLTLEASGGECDPETLSRITLDEAYLIVNRFPRTLTYMLRDLNDISSESKKEEIVKNYACGIVKNLKLVEYYKSMRLEIDDASDGMIIEMSGSLENILSKA